jgi:hypothetical protein
MATKRARRRVGVGRRAMMTGAMETVKNGVLGAVGAVAVEAVLSKLPIPDQLSDGYGRIAVEVAAGIGLGMAVSKFMKKPRIGAAIAQGAATIATYKTVRDAVKTPLGLDVAGWEGESLMSDGLLGFYSPGPNYSVPGPMAGGVGYFESESFN